MYQKTISVEIVGQWNSGKTTLAKSLIARFQQSSYTCPSLVEIDRLRALAGMSSSDVPPFSRFQRARKLLSAALRHPLVTLHVLLQLSKELKTAEGASINRGIIKFSMLIETMERAGNAEIIIWDEGVVAVGLSHARSTERGKIIEAVCGSLGKRFYVCIRMDLRSGLQRWRQRYPGGPTSIPSRRAIARLRKYGRIVDAVIEHLKATRPDSVLVLDGNESFVEKSNKAYEFLALKLEGTTPC